MNFDKNEFIKWAHSSQKQNTSGRDYHNSEEIGGYNNSSVDHKSIEQTIREGHNNSLPPGIDSALRKNNRTTKRDKLPRTSVREIAENQMDPISEGPRIAGMGKGQPGGIGAFTKKPKTGGVSVAQRVKELKGKKRKPVNVLRPPISSEPKPKATTRTPSTKPIPMLKPTASQLRTATSKPAEVWREKPSKIRAYKKEIKARQKVQRQKVKAVDKGMGQLRKETNKKAAVAARKAKRTSRTSRGTRTMAKTPKYTGPTFKGFKRAAAVGAVLGAGAGMLPLEVRRKNRRKGKSDSAYGGGSEQSFDWSKEAQKDRSSHPLLAKESVEINEIRPVRPLRDPLPDRSGTLINKIPKISKAELKAAHDKKVADARKKEKKEREDTQEGFGRAAAKLAITGLAAYGAYKMFTPKKQEGEAPKRGIVRKAIGGAAGVAGAYGGYKGMKYMSTPAGKAHMKRAARKTAVSAKRVMGPKWRKKFGLTR